MQVTPLAPRWHRTCWDGVVCVMSEGGRGFGEPQYWRRMIRAASPSASNGALENRCEWRPAADARYCLPIANAKAAKITVWFWGRPGFFRDIASSASPAVGGDAQGHLWHPNKMRWRSTSISYALALRFCAGTHRAAGW